MINKTKFQLTYLWATKLTEKKLILAVFFTFMLFAFSYAQKYAYVDTDYILENIPEYTDAQNQLDDISIEYQTEIEDKFAEIDKLYKNYQAEAVLLPEDMKKKKEEEIINKEKEAKDLQRKRFGKDGDLFIKRQELVKPIQEKVYNAIEEIATDKNYSFVFDKSGSLTILYVNPKYDISDDVLDKVGAVMGTVRKEDRTKKNEGKNPARPGGFGEGSVIKREK